MEILPRPSTLKLISLTLTLQPRVLRSATRFALGPHPPYVGVIKISCRNSYKVRFKVSVVEWQCKNETSIHITAKHFPIDCKRVHELCQKYSLLKGQTCGTLGKRRRLCCGKPRYILNHVGGDRGRKGGRYRERKWRTYSVLNTKSESCLPKTTAKKRSPSKCFSAGGCLPYVATMCTKLHTVCDHYPSHREDVCVATIEILFAKNCRTYGFGA